MKNYPAYTAESVLAMPYSRFLRLWDANGPDPWAETNASAEAMARREWMHTQRAARQGAESP